MLHLLCSAFRGMKNILTVPGEGKLAELLLKERLVARYAQGNIHLQTGKYMMKKDIEEYQTAVLEK